MEAIPIESHSPVVQDTDVVFTEIKYCRGCCCHKSITDFYRTVNARGTVILKCKTCVSRSNRERHLSHPEVRQDQLLRLKYGMTLIQFLEMSAAQGNVCAICGQPETAKQKGRVRALSVDHDHSCCPGTRSCGKCIRGLLCTFCNNSLAGIERVGSADGFCNYLERYR
jgi:hypothetical protein